MSIALSFDMVVWVLMHTAKNYQLDSLLSSTISLCLSLLLSLSKRVFVCAYINVYSLSIFVKASFFFLDDDEAQQERIMPSSAILILLLFFEI